MMETSQEGTVVGMASAVSERLLGETTDREMLDTDEHGNGAEEGHKLVPDTLVL